MNPPIKIPFKVAALPAFTLALHNVGAQPLSLQNSYRLARCRKVVEAALEPYNVARQARLQAVGEKVGDQYIVKDPERREALIKELTALIETTEDVVLPITEKLRMEAGVTILANDLMHLLDIIEDPEAPSESNGSPEKLLKKRKEKE